MNSQTITDTRPSGSSADTSGSWQQSARNSCANLEQCVQDRPRSAMLVSLGAGLGIGVLIGAALGGSRDTSNRWFERQTAERIGHRLMSQLGHLLPDAISDRLSI